MKKWYFIITFLILCQSSFVFAEPGYLFNKPLDYYEKNIVSPIVPSNAQRNYYDNIKFPINSQLEYKWQIKMPKVPEDDGCKATLVYYRITPQHAKYNFSVNGINVKTGTYLDMLFKDICGNDVIDVSQNFIKTHLDYVKREYCGNYKAEKQKEIAQRIINENPKILSTNYFFMSKQYNDRYRGVFIGNYENIIVYFKIGDCLKSPEVIEHTKRYGFAIINKLAGNNIPIEQTAEKPKETQKEQPQKEEIPLKVSILPSPMGDIASKVAYLPATKDLPARIVVETKPKTKVRFQILKYDKTSYLKVTNQQKSDTVEVISDNNGQAKALFFYNGGKITSPKQYEIKVTNGDKSDTLIVYVGLGLAFKTVKAVQGAYGDRHPFILTLISKHFPNLNLGLYFSVASREVWHGFTLGVKLEPYWLNKPKNLPNDKIFYGITKISPTMVNMHGENNVLTAVNYLDRETVYELSKYTYPAIKMMSDGIHNYKVKGELILIDQNGKNYGKIDEDLIQSDALIVLSKEKPEHFLTSLVCSFEAQSWDQTLMTEILTSLPVYGNFMDNFFQVTNLMCMFGKSEYGNLFLEMSKYLGGKWVDYLEDDKVFNKLTPKQQKAVKWAKNVLEQIEEVEEGVEFIHAIDNILKNPHPQFKEQYLK